MGAVEREIDRYAEELGQLDDIEDQVETAWIEQREELAERLAKGADIRVDGRTLLDATDVCDRLFSNQAKEANDAMVLCVNNPILGGKHMARMMRKAAEELIDSFSDRFKAEIEKDIEKGDEL